MKVAVLGVGLIGGSIGLAARRRAGAHVVGYDPDAGVLSNAIELGAVDEAAFQIADAVANADVVFVAAPVGATAQTVRLALDEVGPACVVSDVGSTKRQIVEQIDDPRFIGGHPLAGAETAGVENARENLFDGATWYLTPVGSSAPIERLGALVERFGARTVAIDADVHDRLMASVSHLPHVFANLLVSQVMSAVESSGVEIEGDLLGVGPSFRDATRVAGANTAIWTDIYMSNRDALVAAIDETIGRLDELRTTLADGDRNAVAAWNDRVRDERKQLSQTTGLAQGS